MSKVAKWIFPAAGGKDGIVGTAKAVVGFMTGNAGLVMDGFRQVAGMGRKGDAQARQASILTLTLGETPREAVLGRVCTAGSLVDVFNFGGQYGTDKVTRCVALADHAIDGIEGFYVNEVYYPWVGEGQQAAFSNKLSFHFRNASPDGYEPPLHVQQNGGWTATDRLCGVTHIWIDWYVDDKVWPQGHPELRFVLRGLRVYDPRFDPQFGYTGPNPQTWADRSSHRFSRNAKLLRYAYTRGIFAEGHHGDPAYLLIGRGLSEEEAPADRVIADANLCDELVDGVARYCADGVISASQPFIEVDGMFAAAMAGQIVQREGTVDVEAGQAKAVVATITDADLVTGEKVGFSRFLGDQDGGRLNTFIGRYIEPLLGWKDHSAPVLRDLNDIQADGGPRPSTLSLALVTEVKQSLRVTEIARRLARLERRGNIVLPPRFAGLEEGDWIAWQSARRHKGATVRYRIEAYRQPENWRLYLTLREIASSAYGVPDPVEAVVTPPPAPVPIDALALSGVTAEAITLPGEDSALPAVRLRWDAPVDAAVLAIRAEVRRVGETEIASTRTEAVNDGVMVATNGVAPKASLECRLVPIGDPSRPVVPSNWITVSTSGVVAGDLGPGSPVVKRINDLFGDIKNLDDALALFDADLDALTSQVSAQGADIASLEEAISNEATARATDISVVSAKLTPPPNEYANADLSNGAYGFTPIWGFGGPLPTISLVNGGEAIRFQKSGGDYDGSLTRYGIVAMDGGGVSISAGGAPPRNMWPVTSGERIGFAVGARTRSGSAAWFLDVRWCDKNGANEVSLGGATTAFGNTSFTRIGVVNTVPGDGYVWAIMTVYLGWDGSLGVGDMELRRPAFARLAATAPSTALPAYSAPAGGRQIQRLETSVTSAQQAIVDLENGKASAADLAATRAQVDDLDAETFILQQSLTDVSNRLSTAKVDIRAAIGSTPAMVQLKDSQNGSVLAMVAQSLLLGSYDAGGTLVPVITLLGQRAQIDGAVDINVGSNAVTIRSAASGARIEMTGSRLSMYDG